MQDGCRYRNTGFFKIWYVNALAKWPEHLIEDDGKANVALLAAKNKKRKSKKKAEKSAGNNGEVAESKNELEDEPDDVEGEAAEDEEDVGPSRVSISIGRDWSQV